MNIVIIKWVKKMCITINENGIMIITLFRSWYIFYISYFLWIWLYFWYGNNLWKISYKFTILQLYVCVLVWFKRKRGALFLRLDFRTIVEVGKLWELRGVFIYLFFIYLIHWDGDELFIFVLYIYMQYQFDYRQSCWDFCFH